MLALAQHEVPDVEDRVAFAYDPRVAEFEQRLCVGHVLRLPVFILLGIRRRALRVCAARPLPDCTRRVPAGIVPWTRFDLKGTRTYMRRPLPETPRGRALPVCLALLVLSTSIALLAGCARGGETQAPPEATPEQPALEAMRLEVRNETLPQGFPLEIPMPGGEVSRVDHQGTPGAEAWQYEMVLGAPVASAADWYEQAYSGRSWTLTERSADGNAVELVFHKGLAESLVSLVPDAHRTTRARASIGLGVPVTQTY